MHQGTGRRAVSRTEGLPGDWAAGAGTPELDHDLGTEIEDEMLATGRGHITPREGLVGAHEERRAGLGRDLEQGTNEPPGHGADVAPTRKAEEQ